MKNLKLYDQFNYNEDDPWNEDSPINSDEEMRIKLMKELIGFILYSPNDYLAFIRDCMMDVISNWSTEELMHQMKLLKDD